MCGIVAIFSYLDGAPAVDSAELLAIREAMAVRGPDDAGLWRSEDDRVGLGHRRLAIIDLSATGHQPMATPDGRLRIVFNGEIYNYRELRRALEQAGCIFRSTSDTEILLHLYDRHGPDMVQRLRGMYAFVIWDAARRAMLAVRDPFGIKPLYYADDGRTIRIASQVKALLAGGSIDATLSPAGAVGFFLLGYVPEPYTVDRGIRALPAGTWLRVGARGPESPTRFFSIAEEIAKAEAAAPRPVDATERRRALRAALMDSIEHHLVADVPVGVFLSAGLDSASVVGLAAERRTVPLRTITLGFEEYRGGELDEVPFAEALAATYRTEHETRWVRQSDFQRDLQLLLAAMDQPSVDGVNTYFVSKMAAEAGLRVALSGLGGDELFGSYPSYRQIPSLVRALRPLRAAPQLGRWLRQLSGPIVGRVTSPKYAGILEYGTSVPEAYLLRRGLHMPWEMPAVLDPELVREGSSELQLLERLAADLSGVCTEFGRVATLELSWYMRNQLLRDSDWAGMAHSLEIRVPLVDLELFRAVLPMILHGRSVGKRDMAATPATPLPGRVLDRPKTGFSIPVRDWLMPLRPHGPQARGLRSWSRLLFEGYTKQAAAGSWARSDHLSDVS
jgi:asparagine synthase (glutamine-hydrolysing)